MGLFDSLFSFGGTSSGQKKDIAFNKQIADTEAVKQGFLGGLALEQGSATKAQLAAAEQARANLRARLGQPGTYPMPGAPTATTTATPSTPASIFQAQPMDPMAAAMVPEGPNSALFKNYLSGTRTGIIDPNASVDATAGTANFQIMSQLTAEAQQLLNQQGPLWDSFSQSVMGPIIEGAAETYKNSIDIINQNAAKGGSARRTAVTDAARINALEQSNRGRAQELWLANLALQAYARDRATQQVTNNEAFLDSVYRDQYSNAMTAAGNFIAGTAVPVAQSTSAQIVAMQQKEIRDKSNWLGNLLLGGISVAGAYLTANTGSPFSSFA